MTPRELCYNILHYKPAERLPAVRFGYWPDLLREWADQGHITHEQASHRFVAEAELDRLIGWDFPWYCTSGSHMGLYPPFEQKELETLPDGSKRIQTAKGVIERIKPGITSIPSEDDYLMKDREAFETLFKPRMQYVPERTNVEYYTHFNERRDPTKPIGISIGSLMGDIRDMTTVKGMSYLMYDEDEELFAELVDTYADMQYACVEALLATGAQYDFAHYWEDICFKNGPLLSPTLFRELCEKHYKKRNDLCHRYGIDIISLDCDGVVDALLPVWLDSGVNLLFPMEVGVWGDQFAAARKKYGERILAVGGMDKAVFRKDKAAVDAELERLKPLIAMGGFIPCPDHNILPGSKFELVQYYVEEIKKIRI